MRRHQIRQPSESSARRRILPALFVFVAAVLLADALIGEKGVVQTARARREAGGEMARLAALREENAQLREEKRRLSEDPARIEAEAREQLGLTRPGEVMFILKDIEPQAGSPASADR